MALPLILAAAGTALQVFGTIGGNIQKAIAEEQNAEYYRKQAQFVQESMFREQAIASREYAFKKGAQLGAAAKGGADISGSVLNIVAGTLAQQIEELSAIRTKGKLDLELAMLRGNQSSDVAGTLRSPTYNLTQTATTALTNYAAYKGA